MQASKRKCLPGLSILYGHLHSYSLLKSLQQLWWRVYCVRLFPGLPGETTCALSGRTDVLSVHLGPDQGHIVGPLTFVSFL